MPAPYTSHDWLKPAYWTTPYNPEGLVAPHMPVAQASIRVVRGRFNASLWVVTRSAGQHPHLSHHALTYGPVTPVTVDYLIEGLRWLTAHATDNRPR